MASVATMVGASGEAAGRMETAVGGSSEPPLLLRC